MTNRFMQNLLHLRKIHNVSQKELAEYIDRAIATISNWQAGRQEPVISEFVKICEFFNVPVIDMLFTELEKVDADKLRKMKASKESYLVNSDFSDIDTLNRLKAHVQKLQSALEDISNKM